MFKLSQVFRLTNTPKHSYLQTLKQFIIEINARLIALLITTSLLHNSLLVIQLVNPLIDVKLGVDVCVLKNIQVYQVISSLYIQITTFPDLFNKTLEINYTFKPFRRWHRIIWTKTLIFLYEIQVQVHSNSQRKLGYLNT